MWASWRFGMFWNGSGAARAAILLVIWSCLAGAVTLTTIQDTVIRADGRYFTGSVDITWPAFQASDGTSVARGSHRLEVRDGYLRVSLVAGGVYEATYTAGGKVQGRESWVVPESALPIRLTTLRTILYSDSSASAIQGVPVDPTAPAADQALMYDLVSGRWKPRALPSCPTCVRTDVETPYANPSWLGSLDWSKVDNKPTTFSPAAHASAHASGGGDQLTLAISQISSLQAILDAKEPTITTLPASKGGLGANASAFSGLLKFTAGVAGIVSGTGSDCVRVDGTSGACGSGGGTWGGITGLMSAQVDLTNALNAREPTITPGSAGQYLRGDKTWQPLNRAAVGLNSTDDLPEGIKKFFDTALARGAISCPTGCYDPVTGVITPPSGGTTTGLPNNAVVFTAETSKFVDHTDSGLSTKNVIVDCADSAGNVKGFTYSVSDLFDLTISFPTGVAFTGRCAWNAYGGGKANARLVFVAANSGDLTAAEHGFTTKDIGVSCNDDSGGEGVKGYKWTVNPTTLLVHVEFPTGVLFTGWCAVNGNASSSGGGGAPSGGVPTTRQIIVSAPLTGGGDLSQDRPIGLPMWGSGSRPIAANALGVTGNCAKFGPTGIEDHGSPCGGSPGPGGYSAGALIDAAQLATNVIAVDADAAAQKLTGTISWDFASLASGTCETKTFTLAGAQPGDSLTEGWPADTDIRLTKGMTATLPDTVAVHVCNYSGATIDPLSRVYRATIVR